jgi:ribosome-binding protein aMBF1 (putative translation factor)
MDFQEWWQTAKKSPENPNGWTTISLAKKIGRAQSIVSRILNRKHRPDPVSAVRLVVASGGKLTLDDIYGTPKRYRSDRSRN